VAALREERAALLEQVNEQGVKLEKLLKERSDWASYFGSREVSRDEVVDVLRNEKKELSALLFSKTRALEAVLQENRYFAETSQLSQSKAPAPLLLPPTASAPLPTPGTTATSSPEVVNSGSSWFPVTRVWNLLSTDGKQNS